MKKKIVRFQKQTSVIIYGILFMLLLPATHAAFPSSMQIPTKQILPSITTDLQPTSASYNLLIVTADVFADSLQPLVDHKNSIGMTTTLVTLSGVYDHVG
ncbi:MAG: hypothetical protein KKC68_03655, partial [Candidatus Thermoplasmatota archaeon]|nr:hypothetical protein [Candidatus Thermoplasmatota archaeon]MBU1940846.1 hypothetical protein [Candidatus Thermoplasmatota archaeon]